MKKHNLLSSAAGRQWERIGVKDHYGIVVPLFSLYTYSSCGVGEFPDLLPLIDWCGEVGFDVIQLLPLNDCGYDTSPYSALSAYALNPIYIGLTQLPYVKETPQFSKQIQTLQQLKNTARVNYPEVLRQKDLFFREYYQTYQELILDDQDYAAFKKQHTFWLKGYALFKAIKIERNWQSWEEWPLEWRNPSLELLETLYEQYNQEIEFHSFLQFLCFKQMHAVKSHADHAHVFIKGDIPILINKESADAWLHQELFLKDVVAGAPPDMYAPEGQKWGFPIYNWQQMEKQEYRWWIERLHVAELLYHIYRLDHVVGFYRIWGIPKDSPPSFGHFIESNRALWVPQGEKIMRMMLKNSMMLPIGEDLGTIPPEVRINLRSLGICGTKVIRWEKDWEGDKQFIDPVDYLPESMTTVSTHDSETLYQWWEAEGPEAQEFCLMKGWPYTPYLTYKLRADMLKLSHHSGSLFHINMLSEYLYLVPGLNWSNPMDERVNVPGTIADSNWTYRFYTSLEKIVSNSALRHAIEEVLRK